MAERRNEIQDDYASEQRDTTPQHDRVLGLKDSALIPLLITIALISHALNMFNYPIYLGDEGIYMEQAWAVLREGKLAPYTYFYDHAPAGWLLIAGWVFLLPGKFGQFGMAINSGRALMLLIHLASVILLYGITKRLSGSNLAAFLTSLIFTLSPLGIYYHRMVLLDNIMVLWLLLALYFLTHNAGRLTNIVISSLFYGLALLTKENAIFFMPVLSYMLYREVRSTYRYRFALAGWLFTWSAVLSLYPLYAFLKNELFPAGTSLIVTGSPGEHVSLIETWLWQLGRRETSILDPNSQFWVFFRLRWWPRDAFIIGVGAFATLANFWLGIKSGQHYARGLIAALLVFSYGFYIVRGSVMLEFYLTPLLPFLAMNIGLLAHKVAAALPKSTVMPLFTVSVACLSAALVYTARDHYTLNITQVQAAQLQWIRNNIPTTAKMAIDDDLWVDLHEPRGRLPVFPNAHSHWKVDGDPEIRNGVFGNDIRNLDYVVLSDDLQENLERLERANGRENFVMRAVRNSRRVAVFQKGDVMVQVMQVNK